MPEDGPIEHVNRILRGLQTHYAHRDEVIRNVLAGEYDLDRYWNDLLGDIRENSSAV